MLSFPSNLYTNRFEFRAVFRCGVEFKVSSYVSYEGVLLTHLAGDKAAATHINTSCLFHFPHSIILGSHMHYMRVSPSGNDMISVRLQIEDLSCQVDWSKLNLSRLTYLTMYYMDYVDTHNTFLPDNGKKKKYNRMNYGVNNQKENRFGAVFTVISLPTYLALLRVSRDLL
ncbi:hypothetical protein YC2023_032646 [Brassica napus]